MGADFWVSQEVRRSWGLPFHGSPRVLISMALCRGGAEVHENELGELTGSWSWG